MVRHRHQPFPQPRPLGSEMSPIGTPAAYRPQLLSHGEWGPPATHRPGYTALRPHGAPCHNHLTVVNSNMAPASLFCTHRIKVVPFLSFTATGVGSTNEGVLFGWMGGDVWRGEGFSRGRRTLHRKEIHSHSMWTNFVLPPGWYTHDPGKDPGIHQLHSQRQGDASFRQGLNQLYQSCLSQVPTTSFWKQF